MAVSDVDIEHQDKARFSELETSLASYLNDDQIAEVRRAFEFGAEAHSGQKRASGEPYISHPLAVAKILADMKLDQQTISAAILHDVIEDTPTAKEQLADAFGSDVAELVDGVSKLTQIKFESKAEAQAENFRKMMLAMVRDIRVILVKLADRLHNMRTLGVLPPAKQRRIAKETLDIYVPIANRLGINSVRQEMQNLGFLATYPLRHRVLSQRVKAARGHRKEVVQKIELAISERLKEDGLNGRVVGREKHLYSIYQKMQRKQLSFSEVFDVYAFRIMVDSVDACYRVLGAMHNLYKPVPGKFKDYIAIPKANGYQSLHTILIGPFGVPIEVQIRTHDMDVVAEAGIAAHWMYKSGGMEGSASDHSVAREWMRSLLEMQQNAGNSLEFIEHVKIDLFPDEVYVFTPNGRIMVLPRGATPVDFAYAVHTDVGNQCIAAKIERRLVPLRTPLMNGQTVEIITSPNARPNPAWLDFVVTGKARGNIRHYLKNLKREEAIALGRRLLSKSLSSFSVNIEQLKPRLVEEVLKEFKLETMDDLLEQIALGTRMPLLVAQRLTEQSGASQVVTTGRKAAFKSAIARYMPNWLKSQQNNQPRQPLAIKGTEGMVVTYAKCCRPIPGDPVMGCITTGRGIVIHTENCKNIADFRNHPEKWVDVHWEPDAHSEFPVEIRVSVTNQRGVLATIAAAIAELDANIDNVGIEERDGRYSTINFTIDVKGRGHLAAIMRRVRSIDRVVKITRSKG